MKIEIWSDYACPYCYIGERQLEKALESFSGEESIDISYKSFELDPSASYETTTDTRERISVKYAWNNFSDISNPFPLVSAYFAIRCASNVFV